MADAKEKLLKSEEQFADRNATLARRVNWTNEVRRWMLETPSFFPYFRTWYRGKEVAEALHKFPMNNVAGLVSNNREALQKTIALIRMRNPQYDPIAMIDPQSELLFFRSAKESDREAAFMGGSLPKEISSLIANRIRSAGDLKSEDYNDLLKAIYNPSTCAGWLDNNIRKSIFAGAKIAVPMLPLIIDEESRLRWKEAYSALKRLYLTTENIEGEAGIPFS